MRNEIVEGDDFSVLPAPVVRLVRWLRSVFSGGTVQDPDPPKPGPPHAPE